MNDPKIIRQNIADNIKNFRELRGYSKRELARLSGLDEKQIRRFEGASDYECMPTLSSLIDIANVLKVSVTTLLL